jgi:hypothetical protein
VAKSFSPMATEMGEKTSRLLLGPVCFRLVVPPLMPGVVGPYPVRGTW